MDISPDNEEQTGGTTKARDPQLETLLGLLHEHSEDVLCEYFPASGELRWKVPKGQLFNGSAAADLPTTLEGLKKLVFRNDLTRYQALWQEIEAKHATDFCLRLITQHGALRWVRLLHLPIPGDPLRSVILIRDLNRFREEAEIEAEKRRMQSVETMAAGLAHEFNNNLTPIRGFIELALEYIGDEHPASKGLHTALSRVEYSAELIEQIQLYGRKTLLNPRPLDLERVLHSMVRVAISLEGEKARNIKFDSEVEGNLPRVWIDQARLRQTFVQLIKNSVAAMPGGGAITLRTQSIFIDNRSGGTRAGDFVRIQLIDTGLGISQDHLVHIFDPFFTTHGRANAKGMGLSMVQGMVAQHGGWIEIRSNERRGTDVRMFFPVKEEDQLIVDGGDDSEETLKVIPAANVGRMMIADDEDYIRNLIAKVFSSEGWLIDEAHDNTEVLELTENQPDYYDLIILDITMPGPTAEETIRRVQNVSRTTRILLVSGHARDERVESLLDDGAAEYVSKPFSPRSLLAVVDEIM